jgi:hypothetical protein
MSIKDMAEAEAIGILCGTSCEDCGATRDDTFIAWRVQQSAYLCTNCVIKDETLECLPTLFCCIGLPIVISVAVVLSRLGLDSETCNMIGIIISIVMIPIFWKVSRRISESYWKG